MKSMVLLLVGAAWILVFNKAMALEESYYAKSKKFSVPVREVSIIATDEGFYPRRISIFKGEKLKIFLTGKDKKPSCLTIPDKDLFMSANVGEITEGSAFFKKAGVYKFYCPTGKIEGRITVLEKPNKEEKVKRKIASEPAKNRIWIPREY
jgi:plastocyanin domain-containing protein